MARQIDLDHTPDKDGGLNDYEIVDELRAKGMIL